MNVASKIGREGRGEKEEDRKEGGKTLWKGKESEDKAGKN